MGNALPSAPLTVAGSCAIVTVLEPMAFQPRKESVTATLTVTTNTVTNEGKLVTVPNVDMTPASYNSVPTQETVGTETSLSGLDIGASAAVRQFQLGLQSQRRIAACIDPRILVAPAFP